MAEHARPGPTAHAWGSSYGQNLTDGVLHHLGQLQPGHGQHQHHHQPVASTSAQPAPYAHPRVEHNRHLHHYQHQHPHQHQHEYDPHRADAYPTVAEHAAPPLLEYDSSGRFRLPPVFEGGTGGGDAALGSGRDGDRDGPDAGRHGHEQEQHAGHPLGQQQEAYHYWPAATSPVPPGVVPLEHRPGSAQGHEAAWAAHAGAAEERRYGDEVQPARGEDQYGSTATASFSDHSYRERLAAARLSGYSWDWQRHHPAPPLPPPQPAATPSAAQMPGYPPHHPAPPPHRDSSASLKRPHSDEPSPLPRSLSVPDVRSHLSRASSIWGPSTPPLQPPPALQARHAPAQPLNLPRVGPLTTHSPLVVRATSPPARGPVLPSLGRSLSSHSLASTPPSPPDLNRPGTSTHANAHAHAPPRSHSQPQLHAHVTDPRASAPAPSTSSDSDGPDSSGDGASKKRRKRRRRLTETPRDVANRKFGCHTCGKMFARPSALATHERSHSKEKPHCCPIETCGRAFAVSSNLRRHQTIYDHWSSEEEKRMFEKRPKGVAAAVGEVGAVGGAVEGGEAEERKVAVAAKRDDRQDSHD